MEKDKYYTPTIEEFHLGFEFEQKERFGDGTVKTKEDFDNAKWISRIMELGESPYIERMISGRNALNGICGIRVKYLDREDIESFGFEFKEYNEMAQKTIYEKVWNAGLCPIVYRLTTYSSDEDGTHVHINIHACDRFSGIIKNKSELAILLKMLDVDDLNSKY